MSLKVISATVKSEEELKKVIEELRKQGLGYIADDIEKEFKNIEFESAKPYQLTPKEMQFADNVLDLFIKQMGIKDFMKEIYMDKSSFALFAGSIGYVLFYKEKQKEVATNLVLERLSDRVIENLKLDKEEIY